MLSRTFILLIDHITIMSSNFFFKRGKGLLFIADEWHFLPWWMRSFIFFFDYFVYKRRRALKFFAIYLHKTFVHSDVIFWNENCADILFQGIMFHKKWYPSFNKAQKVYCCIIYHTQTQKRYTFSYPKSVF